MVRPPDTEILQLQAIAREMLDSGEESAYLVALAVGQHASFVNSRRPASAMARELYIDAARRGASQQGVGIDETNGGLDLITVSGNRVRRYRVKQAERLASGSYKFVVGLGSRLLTSEPDSLLIEERWILGYLRGDDETLDEVIAAEVVGSEGDGPVTLLLGTIIRLSTAPPPSGFTSTKEDLPGFGEEDGESGSGDAVGA
jgi:hypothetical protein